MNRGLLAAIAVTFVLAAVVILEKAFERDGLVIRSSDSAEVPSIRAAPAQAEKARPKEAIFAIDPERVVGVDYETTRRSWTAERMDAGGLFAVTVTDAAGRMSAHCQVDLEPSLTRLAMVQPARVLPPGEAQNLWAEYGPLAAKVRIREELADDSIEFRVIVTSNVREEIVLRVGRRMFAPSVPAEVFELLLEGCPPKQTEEK